MTTQKATGITLATPSQTTTTGERASGLWDQQLLPAPVALDLMTDYSRPQAPSGRRGRHSFALAPALVAALDEQCEAAHVTPRIALLALLAALLGRYAGAEQFSVGYPLDEGPGDAERGARYMLLNADLSGGPSLRALLRRTGALLAAARARPPIPAAQLAAVLNPRGEAAGASRFQVLYAYVGGRDDQLAPRRWLAGGGLETAPADLALVFEARGGGLVGTIGYDADLFAPATAERLAGHLAALLAAALAAPERPLAELALVSAEERERLAAWNRTDTPLPLACLHQLFSAQAARAPGAPALIFEGGQLSYGELEARANQLAHHLREHGVGPERIVAVCMGRGEELIIALLGILKAGGAYLPLDPIYPAARLADMVEDARPVVLLSDGSLPGGLLDRQGGAEPPRVIDLREAAAAIGRQPTEPPRDEATLGNLAYVIYTSGSTGKPKGVLIEHRTAATYVLGAGLLYEITPADRGLHFASVSFDASVDDIFVPLSHGAGLVVTSGYSPPDFAALQGLVVRHGITLISIATAYWHTWISELADGHATLPPSLRLVIIGGEAASGERYNRWRALVPPTVRLFNGYGPTETTVGSTWYVPSPLADEPAGPMAIGRPLPNERAYLLDGQRRLVPIGVQGELYIGGDSLARGYHNRPELTAERFVYVAGLEGDEPVRLYRTGDLARWRDDGVLLYDGRADQQVKVRGFRIEPSEIEATLRSHGAVQAAAVVTHPDPAGELSLAGYVVLREPAEPAALRAYLEERLPHYMVPAALMVLDALPLTPSGKVDRRALPAPALPEARPVAEGDRARTPVEQALITIWEELLGRRGVGVHDNFFELGGHSLLAMRMLSRVAGELGARLPVSILIHHATVAALAEVIVGEDAGAAWSVVVPIQPRGERPPLFCVHGITGDVLWFNELGRCLDPDQPLYGLQARGLAEGQPYATSIEQMAAWYIEGMRSVQPHGPYFIAGASFGSIIAMEMARQLEAAGERVGMVAVFDYDPYEDEAGKGGRLRAAASYLRHLPGWLRNDLLTMGPAELRAWAKWRLRIRLKRALSRLLGGARLPTDAADILPYGAELPAHRRELLLANDVAFERYAPQPCDARVTLFATEGWYTGQAAATGRSGWAPLARGGVEVVVVPGAHETMFKQPHVCVLADRLREQIDAARSAD